MQKVEKGSIMLVSGIWYIAVKDTGKYINCICDHANNTHGWEKDDIDYLATPYEAMRMHGWRDGEEKLGELFRERSCPVETIAEVLAGCHDDRFRR